MLRKKKKKMPSGIGTDEVEAEPAMLNVNHTGRLDLLMACLVDVNTVRNTISSVSSRPTSRMSGNCTDLSESDSSSQHEYSSPSLFFEKPLDPIAPNQFGKTNKNETNEKFLKSFNELKDVLIHKPTTASTASKVATAVSTCSCSKWDEQTKHFCHYLNKLLDGFDENSRDEIQFDILTVVRNKKKELNK